jgi:hypothetical protein
MTSELGGQARVGPVCPPNIAAFKHVCNSRMRRFRAGGNPVSHVMKSPDQDLGGVTAPTFFFAGSIVPDASI